MVSIFIIIYIIILIIGLIKFCWKWFFPGKVDMKGKCAVITGGSSGTGLALAQKCLNHGAKYVFLLARNKGRLDSAVEKLHKGEDQNVIAISADVSDYDQMTQAFSQILSYSTSIDYLFCAAGFARPALLDDTTPKDFQNHINVNYLGAAYAVKIAKPHLSNGSHVMFCGSACSIMSFAGYAAYSPSKYALHGLADTLRNELRPYGINIHMGYISSIDSPGFAEENKSKPKVCAEIEGHANLYSPDEVAQHMFRCIGNNEYFLVLEPLTYFMEQCALGVAPSNNICLDIALKPISFIARIWGLWTMETTVQKYFNKEKKNE